MKIQPKKYKFKDDISQYRIGLTSTELTNVLPSYLNKRDFVDLGIKKSFLTFDDSSLHYIIINSIKEQQKQIIELIESNKLLLSRIKELEDKIAAKELKRLQYKLLTSEQKQIMSKKQKVYRE